MRTFGFLNAENWQFLLLDDCWSPADLMIAFPSSKEDRIACNKVTDAVLGLLSNRRAIKLPGYGKSLCFRKLVVGHRHLNPFESQRGNGAFFRDYRDAVLSRHNIPTTADDGVFRIFISMKAGHSYNSRDIGNAESLASELRKINFGRACEVKVVRFSAMSMDEQLASVASASVLFTPSGATSYLSPFLGDSSTLVLLPFCVRGEVKLKKGIRCCSIVFFLSLCSHCVFQSEM